jgi:rubrerythrin
MDAVEMRRELRSICGRRLRRTGEAIALELTWRSEDNGRRREGGPVNEKLREALDFAIAKEKEAEAFYKTWAAKVQNPAVEAVFAEMAATEHGHMEMLSRITPEEMVARDTGEPADLDLSEHLVEIEAAEGMSVQEAMILAMKREESAVALYERLATLGGEAASLFTALANEERKHKGQIEAEYDEHILTEN